MLRLRVTLLGSAQIALRRIGGIGDDAMSARIEMAQPEERLGVAGTGKLGPISERGGIVSALIGRGGSQCHRVRIARPEPPEPDHGSRTSPPTPRKNPPPPHTKDERGPPP